MDLSNLSIFQIYDLRVAAGGSRLVRRYFACQSIKGIQRGYTCQKHFQQRPEIGPFKRLRAARGTRGLGKVFRAAIVQRKSSLSI
jgi:hypothetical protein